MDGHHRIKQKSEIDALGLDGQLERLAIPIERPGSLSGRNSQADFIAPIEQTFLECAVGGFIEELNRAIGNRHHGNDATDARGVKTGEQ